MLQKSSRGMQLAFRLGLLQGFAWGAACMVCVFAGRKLGAKL